MASTMNNNKYT